MSVEIERKFLVESDFKSDISERYHIVQAYLSSNPERSVRVRIKDKQAFLTIKGASGNSGTTRYEWEKEISTDEAEELLKLAESGVIEKIRYIIPAGKNLFFEVDEFLGDNQGLILAEIELPTEEYSFKKPSWLGKEVTGEKKYYNSMLKKYPYKTWK